MAEFVEKGMLRRFVRGAGIAWINSDPHGLPGMLQQLRSQSPDNSLFSLSFSTHPPAQQRLDLLEQSGGHRLDAFAGKPPVRIEQRLAQKR